MFRSAPRRRALRPTLLAATLALAATTACDAGERTVDCIRLAAAVSDSVTAVTVAVAEGVEGDDLAHVTDTAEEEADHLKDSVGHPDVRAAANDVLDQLEQIRIAAEEDTTPDLTPLENATEELTRVCSPE